MSQKLFGKMAQKPWWKQIKNTIRENFFPSFLQESCESSVHLSKVLNWLGSTAPPRYLLGYQNLRLQPNWYKKSLVKELAGRWNCSGKTSSIDLVTEEIINFCCLNLLTVLTSWIICHVESEIGMSAWKTEIFFLGAEERSTLCSKLLCCSCHWQFYKIPKVILCYPNSTSHRFLRRDHQNCGFIMWGNIFIWRWISHLFIKMFNTFYLSCLNHQICSKHMLLKRNF